MLLDLDNSTVARLRWMRERALEMLSDEPHAHEIHMTLGPGQYSIASHEKLDDMHEKRETDLPFVVEGHLPVNDSHWDYFDSCLATYVQRRTTFGFQVWVQHYSSPHTSETTLIHWDSLMPDPLRLLATAELSP